MYISGMILCLNQIGGCLNAQMKCFRFVKLHIPMEALKRYAEILKLRMKLKVGEIALGSTLGMLLEHSTPITTTTFTLKECIYNTRTVCCNDVFWISVNICKVWWNLSYILSAYLSFLCLLSWFRVFQIIDGLLHWQCPDYIVVKHLVLNTWEHEGMSYLRYQTYHQ